MDAAPVIIEIIMLPEPITTNVPMLIPKQVPTRVPACVQACVPTCVPACAPACAPACVPAFKDTTLSTYSPLKQVPITPLITYVPPVLIQIPTHPIATPSYKINITSTVSGHIETIYAYVDPISKLLDNQVVNSIIEFLMTKLIPNFIEEQEIVHAMLLIQKN
jgi:hypothetical protein